MFEFIPLPTPIVRALQRGEVDAYGLPPERMVSDGDGTPCRHCLKMITAGQDYLCLAHRPFRALNAFTETGPIFICADECDAGEANDALPEISCSSVYIARGYSKSERIVYGTGMVTKREEIPDRIRELLRDEAIEFVDIRSASNNCFHCRAIRSHG